MNNLVLYRKYRPLKFADVINQEHVKTTLINAVASGRVGHAYLFTGPRGVGKTTMARILARAVNCQNRRGSEPCNECAICKQLLDNNSLDILEIDAASHTGVDNIREITDHVQYSPTNAKFKVIVIDEVHMLSKGAFNALLKTLEEPPEHAIFILATTEVHKVPATIISRTQRFDFKKVSLSDLIKLLEFVATDSGFSINKDALSAIAAAADGSFRDGLSLLDQVINYSDLEITEELVRQVLGLTGTKFLADFMDLVIDNQAKKAVESVSALVASGADLYQFHKDLLEYLRSLLIEKVGIQSRDALAETEARLKSQAEKIETGRLMVIIEAFQKAGSELKWASIPALPLELAVVEVTGGQESVNSNHESGDTKENTKTEPAPISHPRNDELKHVLNHWPQILERVKDYNHSLISSMKLAEPVEIQNGELVLLFPYKFHKDAIGARKNRIVIDQVIEEVAGLKIMVKPLIKNEWQAASAEKNSGNQNLVESALNILGGEVE
ncbi:MAG: DNA polymerase III subunit gamma/tau [Candidatus Doudnabacteria bacterium]|nr:DNA polymerase III subunit gamma/tau [Candidatus Doudnabacteria bacterium]